MSPGKGSYNLFAVKIARRKNSTVRDFSKSSAAKTQCALHARCTNTELHVDYAVGVADIAAREGSPHNVLHSSSNRF